MFCTRCGAASSDTAQFCSRCGAPFGVAAAVPGPVFHYSGFWRRFFAMMIDGIIFSPIVGIMFVSTGIFGILLHPNPDEDFAAIMAALFGFSLLGMLLLLLLGGWLYHTLMESSRYQGTLGKMALGAIVTDLNGNRISFARANGRFFGKWISSAVFNIGYLMAGFTEKKQALHDMLAGCLVIQK